MGGFGVLQRLRAADEQLAILMLAARDAPADQVEGLESGADDYVIKPFMFEVLLAWVHARLKRRQVEHPSVLSLADPDIGYWHFTLAMIDGVECHSHL
jgi:DNA-binding response OmpR family regulator